MNKRDFEEVEAEEDPTVDTEEDGEKEKEEVDTRVPPKKRAKSEVRPMSRAEQIQHFEQVWDAHYRRMDRMYHSLRK